MARPVLRLLCLGLIVLLTASVAAAKTKEKAAKTKAQDSTSVNASETADPAPSPAPAPVPRAQENAVKKTFSFSPADEPLNPQPSLHGFPGLWKSIGANPLPAGSFGASGWVDRINRNPGFLTITTSGWGGFVSLNRRIALATQVNVSRRILVRRADQLGFGQEVLAGLGFGGCPLPNCRPANLVPIVRFPGQRIPLLRNVYTGTLSTETGFYNLYPWASRRSQSGVGELEVAGHINLWDTGEGSGVAWALRPHVTIPTRLPNAADAQAATNPNGDAMFGGGRMIGNGVQTGSWQWGMDLLVEGHLRDVMGLYFNVGFNYLHDPRQSGTTLVDLSNNVPVRIGINIPRTSRLQLLVEYTADHFVGGGRGNRGAEDARNWANDATAGFRAYFTPWLSMSGGYRHTLNQWGGDKHGFVAQLSASYIPLPEVKGPIPPTVSCTADATTVRAGTAVRLTATASTTSGGTLTYTWSTTGGRIEGSGPTARLDTTGLSPGTYSVTVRVDDGKGGFADCTVQITIQAPPPPPSPKAPTVTCSISKTSATPGEVLTLRATGSSPDKRPLNYDWTVTSGRIDGSGAQVRWDTTGLSSGTYTATVRVTDDRGLSADCSVSVTIQVPEVRKAQKLNECKFKANSARVDNVCKAVLDDVALRLQSEGDSRAVSIGYKGGRERNAKLSAERASNVKAYLTREKSIDGSRIEVRTGADDASKVEIWLVPRGASASEVPGTMAPETPAPPARRRARKAAATTAPAAEKAPMAEKAPAEKAPATKKAPAEKAPAAKKPAGAGTPR